ncbi:phosphotransferase enzyme family protein [Maritalea porphyrae]|uniref:phosphotransferase enzyme family protein n=1 Tax=Maritalea porphyrae TaxID=880732 RepID=UPI0022AEB957|nr:phosphotransferase [Maritalea porphyrae]MCZ4273523.1 phosphotransferase [Maritalea porphyrae]
MADADLIAILNLWGDFELVGRLAGGHRNCAYQVRGAGGNFVLKSTRREETAIDWLLAVHQVAQEQGIVVPSLQHGKNGCLVQEGWTLEAFIEGKYPEKLPIDWLQAVMPKFHDATCNFSQRPGFASSLDLLRIETGGDVDLNKMPNELVDALRKAWRDASSSPQAVVHGDINVSNLVEVQNGGFALLDWDETRVDFSFYDEMQFAAAQHNDAAEQAAKAYEIACSWLVEPKYARRLALSFLASTYT